MENTEFADSYGKLHLQRPVDMVGLTDARFQSNEQAAMERRGFHAYACLNSIHLPRAEQVQSYPAYEEVTVENSLRTLRRWDPDSFANATFFSRKCYVFHGVEVPEGEMWSKSIQVQSTLLPHVVLDHIHEFIASAGRARA